MKEKMIQIPESLYLQIATYILVDQHRTEDCRRTIEQGILNKFDRQINHDLYSKYKTAPTPEQREKARQEHLDRIGIPDSFRW